MLQTQRLARRPLQERSMVRNGLLHRRKAIAQCPLGGFARLVDDRSLCYDARRRGGSAMRGEGIMSNLDKRLPLQVAPARSFVAEECARLILHVRGLLKSARHGSDVVRTEVAQLQQHDIGRGECLARKGGEGDSARFVERKFALHAPSLSIVRKVKTCSSSSLPHHGRGNAARTFRLGKGTGVLRSEHADAPGGLVCFPRSVRPNDELSETVAVREFEEVAVQAVFVEGVDETIFQVGIELAIARKGGDLAATKLLLPGESAQIVRLIGGSVRREAREMARKIEKIGLHEGGKAVSNEETLGELRMKVANQPLLLPITVVLFDKKGGVVEGEVAISREGFAHIVVEGDASAPSFARLDAIAQGVAPRKTEVAVFFIDG